MDAYLLGQIAAPVLIALIFILAAIDNRRKRKTVNAVRTSRIDFRRLLGGPSASILSHVWAVAKSKV
jgi:hypothetical protein